MGLFQKRYPPEIADRIPPGQRLVKTWPVLHYGPIPSFDGATWDLEVSGLVDEPFTLSYEELRALPTVTVDADMHCVTGWTTLDNTWEGVPFRTIVERAVPRPEARWVIAHCAYGYTSNLSLEAIDRLAALGVGAVPVPGALRMVTHVDVDDEGLAHAIDAWRSVAASFAKGE